MYVRTYTQSICVRTYLWGEVLFIRILLVPSRLCLSTSGCNRVEHTQPKLVGTLGGGGGGLQKLLSIQFHFNRLHHHVHTELVMFVRQADFTQPTVHVYFMYVCMTVH